MQSEAIKARRGDLIVVRLSTSWVMLKGGTSERQFWSVGRVTSATREGHVKAYRVFGLHHESRGRPVRCMLVSADQADVPAVESDMLARITKQWDANEFADPDSVRTYLKAFRIKVPTH
jgi:hypothetical protein